jgi:nitroreductase
MLADLVKKNRSYRRFFEDEPVAPAVLRELVDLARLSPSAANLQPLRFFLSCDPKTNANIFQSLAWAGYLPDWPGPAAGERPAAYIVVLGDKERSKNFACDHGIVAQTMLLGAVEKGLGGCMLGAIDKDKLRGALRIPERYEIMLVVALGRPKETVVIEPVAADGDIKYTRDEKGVHHVPKRSLNDLIIAF